MSVVSPSLITPRSGAVLFDVDGTLADTDPLHAKAWQLVARSCFDLTFTWTDYHKACIIEGLPPAEFLRRLGADMRSEDAQSAKAAIFRRLLQTESSLAPGVAPFIDRIREAGIAVAIVSGGSRCSVEAFLASLWPGPPPALSVSREDTTRHKPHPAPYLFALGQLRCHAGDCVAVEDTARGIQSAQRAGLHSIKIGDYGVASIPEADLTVTSMADLSVLPDSAGGLAICKTEF